jgi:hypothetical protein
MSTHPQTPVNSGDSAEIGPPPYYHRSDCHICLKQDGVKTGSELLDATVPGGYIVEGEHFLAEHGPIQESTAGTVIVEARRHLLDFEEVRVCASMFGTRDCRQQRRSPYRPAEPVGRFVTTVRTAVSLPVR